jgi:PhnB protein
MMQLNTYLNFAGRCAEAFHYYEKHLGGKIKMMMAFDQGPKEVAVALELKDSILHAKMTIAGTELMGADIPKTEPMRSAYLSLSVDSDTEAERIFKALSEGGQVTMPMQEIFFATRFGQTRDKFGMLWMILQERPMQSGA